ncbi:CorA domain containing protein [Pyrenophora teres f. maculata]|nr:CorA domain containing protein [Pyrenophora teres f. maculata]
MGSSDDTDYPFDLPTYIAAFDDGHLASQELKHERRSWRSEGYAKDSHIQIFDHNHGIGTIGFHNDSGIDKLLGEAPPQVRFVLILPMVHEHIADTASQVMETADLFRRNELYDDGSIDPSEPELPVRWEASKFNISRRSLIKILTKYDIAPAACSHLRGQEQIFGSRVTKNEQGHVQGFEFWYAIRARAYFGEVDMDADLKITVVTKYTPATNSTIVLLKYRSYNDLTCKLKLELMSKLYELVTEPSTQEVAKSPFAISLLHFNSTAQWYRRAARDPRDSVRGEEEKAHVKSEDQKNEANAINVRRLHLTMRNLDQDKVQLTFILDVIDRLRKQHDLFYRLVKKTPDQDQRDWLYLRVEEEFDRLESQLTYFRSSIEDVANRAQRLLDLLFNLSGQQNARWSEKVGKQAMYESASMRAIAIVSMLFLPGTFVCGVLGTNLFYQENSSSVSTSNMAESAFRAASQWWILFITIVPLTCLTFFAWYMWRRRTENEITRKIAREDEESGKLQKELRRKSSARRRSTFASIEWARRFSTRN